MAETDTVVARPCTCHPDDNPPKPCPQRYALSECERASELARLQAENEALRRERGGLATMLEQTADRLVHVLGDNPKISFILTMRDSAKRLRAALEAK